MYYCGTGGLIEGSASLVKMLGDPIRRVLIPLPFLANQEISDTGKRY
jgi:hypothetical protein